MNQYYAHIDIVNNKRKQTIEEHLINVANKSSLFAKEFQLNDIAYNLGILHDIGKCSQKMTKRLEGENEKPFHALQGAKEIQKINFQNEILDIEDDLIKFILSNIIISHHTGLRNEGLPTSINDSSLIAALKKEEEFDIHYYNENIKYLLKNWNWNEINNKKILNFYSLYFLAKMLFSSVIDADFLDTEEFMTQKSRDFNYPWDEIENNFYKFVEEKNKENPNSEINVLRKQLYEEAISKSEIQQGIYSFSAPTGLGKTISTMGFALKHRKKHNLKRIIYIAPYINLVEQTSLNYKKTFGNKYVLEHYSDVSEERKESLTKEIVDIYSENYDYPIINTTFTQFFDSLYSHKVSKNRKLHNFANSIIIIDEAHTISFDKTNPIYKALFELVLNYGCTVILNTATQSNYEFLLEDFQEYFDCGIKVEELISNYKFYFQKVPRSKFEIIPNPIDLNYFNKVENSSLLIIVNSRKNAQKIYLQIQNDNKYHLSNYMCKRHIDEIKEKIYSLRFQCILVSTTLIENGMDFSFDEALLQLKGLPNLHQGSGRKDRNNLKSSTPIKIFDINDNSRIFEKEKIATKIVWNTLHEINSLNALNLYNQKLYDYLKTRDKYNIDKLTDELNYRTIGETFSYIDDNTIPIIINYKNELDDFIHNLKFSRLIMERKNLQKYTVSLYKNDFENLNKKGFIDKYIDDYENYYYVLNQPNAYDNEVGLIVDYQIPLDDYNR